MWLMQESVLREFRAAMQKWGGPTAEDRARAEQYQAASRDGGPRSLALAGDVAEIRVHGVLTKTPSFLAWLFYGANTAYEDLEQAVEQVMADPSIKSVVLDVDSPGGMVDGMFSALAAIQALSEAKPTSVRASRATSAAYGLAAAAGPITAKDASAEFGSVGVAVQYAFFDDVDLVDLTNSASPDKRPDVRTEEGKAVVVRHLDAVADLFFEAIAAGRGTTVKDVTENFGRGAVMLAAEAKRRGMIDSVAKPATRAPAGARALPEPTTPAGSGADHQENHMDLKTLKKDHPEVYEAAVAEGVVEERGRVKAHLTLGEKSGAMERAIKAIRDGEGLTVELQAEYMAAGMNRRDQKARQAETDDAGTAAAGAAPTNDTQAIPLHEQIAKDMGY